MKVLPPLDRQFTPKASEILRLARAINLGRSRSVRDFRVRLRDAEVQIALRAARGAGVELEFWAIEKESNYFRELFGRTLSAALV